jgi:hypothetical protein
VKWGSEIESEKETSERRAMAICSQLALIAIRNALENCSLCSAIDGASRLSSPAPGRSFFDFHLLALTSTARGDSSAGASISMSVTSLASPILVYHAN